MGTRQQMLADIDAEIKVCNYVVVPLFAGCLASMRVGSCNGSVPRLDMRSDDVKYKIRSLLRSRE